MRRHLKFEPALIVASSALITPYSGMLEKFGCLTPLPVNIFPNKIAPNLLNNMLRNPHHCSFASF